MVKSLLLNCLLLAALLSSPMANAADGYADAMTLSRDWQSAAGTHVAISGCTVTSATAQTMRCLAKSKQGGTASFALDPSGLAPSDVERALRDCSYYVGYPLCRVRVEGEVARDQDEVTILVNAVVWIWTASD